MTEPPRDPFNPYDYANRTDPYPEYARLRKVAPVVRLTIEDRDVYALTRDEGIRGALNNPDVFTAHLGTGRQPYGGVGLLGTDGPYHKGLHHLIAPYLSGRALAEHNQGLLSYTYGLVGRLIAQQWFDAVADLARPLSARLIGDLVGIPWMPPGPRDRFLRWACTPPQDRDDNQMREYVAELGASGRLASGSLGAALYGAVSRDLTAQEATALVWDGVVVGGHEPTVAALTWLFDTLAQHPGAWPTVAEWVAADDQRVSIVPDELCRFQVVKPNLYRTALSAHEIDGYTVPAGGRVLLLPGAANRDPLRWASPTEFRLHRLDSDQHIGFGDGIHRCPGGQTYRMLARAVIAALAGHRVDDWWIENQGHRRAVFGGDPEIRGWAELPIRVRLKR